MAAKVLTEAGADVVMLEAGGCGTPPTTRRCSAWPYDSPRRGAATPDRSRSASSTAASAAGTLDGEPYTQGAGTQFDWFRGAHARRPHQPLGPHLAALRPGRLQAPEPRRPRRRLADHLRRHQAVLRQARSPRRHLRHRSEDLPNEPDGIFQPPPKPRCYELLIKQAADKLKITCIPSRLSILTQPLNGRPACHYCGQCGRGCATHANFSSPSVLLPPALATGKLHIITNAMAREVTDRRQRAGDGRVVRRHDDRARLRRPRADRRARGERVRVGAAAAQLEVGALPARPRRTRAASSAATSPTPPACRRQRVHPEDDGRRAAQRGRRRRRAPLHAVVARQQEARLPARLPHRARRRHDARRRASASMGGIQRVATAFGGYGKSLKDDYRRFYGATVDFAGRGEMIPNEDTLLRDRSERGRHVRHPGAALPLQVERPRDQPGEAHAGDLPRDHPRDGRHAAVADAVARSAATASSRSAASSTRSARRGWATIRRPRC